jgi:hypothetical protein
MFGATLAFPENSLSADWIVWLVCALELRLRPAIFTSVASRKPTNIQIYNIGATAVSLFA